MRNTTIYNNAGTITFRRSSSAITLNFKEHLTCGTNLQNVEKSIRKIYHSRKGYKLCQVDQSGAEALIVAYLCRDGKFRSLFLNRVKPHVFVGMHLFSEIWERKLNENSLDHKFIIAELLNTEIPALSLHPWWKQLDRIIKDSDNWPAQERYYYIAKQVCHSSNYGIRPPTFALNTLEKSRGKIVLSKEKSEQYLTFYHSLFPEIHEWHRELQNQLEATRILYNLFGFPREFTGELKESVINEAYAFPAQSTVGCITAKAIVKHQGFIEDNGLRWNILQDNHDSFLTEAPEDEALDCVKIMKAFMEQDLVSPRGEQFKMKAECQIGFNWSPKKESNEEGMEEVKL